MTTSVSDEFLIHILSSEKKKLGETLRRNLVSRASVDCAVARFVLVTKS